MSPADGRIEVRGHVLHPFAGERPVLFLDIDGVLAAENGGPIDRDALERVETTLRRGDRPHFLPDSRRLV